MTKKSNERQKAIELGLKTYHGKPCIKCEQTEKYVGNWACVQCTTKSTKQRSPEVYKKYIKSEKGQEWIREFRNSDTNKKTQKKWLSKDYEKNKDKYHGYNLKKYNLDTNSYNILLEQQGFSCLICNKHQTDLNQKLSVDHCHESGKVRGLLCGPCNTSLGLLKEDVVAMKNMIEYITRFKCSSL